MVDNIVRRQEIRLIKRCPILMEEPERGRSSYEEKVEKEGILRRRAKLLTSEEIYLHTNALRFCH